MAYIFTSSNENAMTVNHPSFGKGQIVSQDASNVTIDFNGVVKTLVTKFAKLTNEDGSPFAAQPVVEKKENKSKALKRVAYERTLSEEKKRELNFENPDGSLNQDALDAFMDKQEQKKKELFYGKYK